MFSSRWRKVIRDLSQNKARTVLVVAAITVGVIAAGSILSGYSVITREMDSNYQSTNPASAILNLDTVDSELVAQVEARPEIASAEARREVTARLIKSPDEWIRLQLVVVEDFEGITVSRFFSEEGASSPAQDEILIERSSLDEVDMAIGDELDVRVAGGPQRSLSVAGLVHDPGRMPAWMVGEVVGYITPVGLENLGLEPVLDQLQIITVENESRIGNRIVADVLAADLQTAGSEVLSIEVPVPGEHPAKATMTTMLFLLQAFGVLALVSSGALVATLIIAQMKQQSHEIALMKAVGARTSQIASLYLGTVAVLSVVALAIGVPLGILGGRIFVDFTLGLLNFEIASYAIDAWVIPLQIVAALAIPLIAVVYPVAKFSRQPVKEQIADRGIVLRGVTASRGLLSRVAWLPSSTTFGIRNAFRSRSRTILTVFAVSFGGAAFMVALNTGVAWDRAVEDEFAARDYSLEVRLDGTYPAEQIELALADAGQVDALEIWNELPAAIQLATGDAGSIFQLLVPPADSNMINFPLLDGRWLLPDDKDAIVITQGLDDPEPAVGSTVKIDIEGTTTSWTVVGKVRQLSGGETGVAYASNLPAEVLVEGSGNHIRVSGSETSALLGGVELSLANDGIGVTSIATSAEGREALEDHLLIIVGLLLMMAVLISIVGGLGLIEAMSISVLERSRELGIMRAVGASTSKVITVVVIEGLVISVLSWLAAVAISVPATVVVENITGNLFTQAPLSTSFSALGIGIWLAIVLVLGVAASAIPALEIVEKPVNEILAYE